MRNLTAVLAILFIGNGVINFVVEGKSHHPESNVIAAKPNEDESVEVRLTRAHLELAKLNLRRFLEVNKQLPNAFTSEEIEKVRLHVVIDEAELEQRLKGKDADPHLVCIRSAEAAVKIAEADLNGARAVQKRSPTSVNALNVERASVVAKIATLNLERAKQLDGSESVLTHLQWQIYELRHQVLELQLRR